ncbi:MAG: bifunctional glycosyltransferase/class I SAM-dependent methyltransferase [Thermodesulfobacteriota bacterium]|nr:bifunctional glycosyltransferase/class I SAM-dependent methyltransferase [Thermodesulfobacteriota bacterium]
MSNSRLLIFVVAYNAERTISGVLRRIPLDRLPSQTDILVIDDQSHDNTSRKVLDFSSSFKEVGLTVLYNPVNQGYGGNQKIGYHYAIEKGYDAVALLHGDGQYAPEVLPELIAPVLSGECDLCLGSRMMEAGVALKAGMPPYKYIGNRLLSFAQNKILRMSLTEFHSGYRAYSVKGLQQIPFGYNTDDFHFDTEIIIQHKLSHMRIKEVSIPTYYGDEICYVNGVKYAFDVMMSTISGRAHQMGIAYNRKYDVGDARYSIKIGYTSSHNVVLQKIPPGSNVLDLGCGEGHLADILQRQGCQVTGIDIQSYQQQKCKHFIRHDLNDGSLPDGLGTYDYILALDCLEHLDNPERLLATIRARCYSLETEILITVPNIGFITVRLGLFFGWFNYSPAGILDIHHKRLFTLSSLHRMLAQEGFVVRESSGIPAPFPKVLGDGVLSRLLIACNKALIRIWKRLFSYQIYVVAEMKPPLKCLLDRAWNKTVER